jgi:hypothetical protein
MPWALRLSPIPNFIIRVNSVLKDRLEVADRELEARRREVQELHVLLQQAQAALPAPVGTRQHWWRFWQRG